MSSSKPPAARLLRGPARAMMRVDTPSARPLVEQARSLGQQLEQLALRKSRILWELDMALSRRCAALARDAMELAFQLEDADEDAGAVTQRLNLTAKLVGLQTEAEQLLANAPPASGTRRL